MNEKCRLFLHYIAGKLEFGGNGGCFKRLQSIVDSNIGDEEVGVRQTVQDHIIRPCLVLHVLDLPPAFNCQIWCISAGSNSGFRGLVQKHGSLLQNF